MPNTDITFTNQALSLLGADPITLMTDTTVEGVTAALWYEETLAAMLASFDWQWATEEIDLGAATATTTLTDEWTTVYDMPATALRIVNIQHGGIDKVPYRRFGDKVFTNLDAAAEPTMWAVVDQVETDFPPYFRWAFVLELAWVFAGAVTENQELRAQIEQKRQQAWTVAYMADISGAPPRKAVVNRFSSNRR